MKVFNIKKYKLMLKYYLLSVEANNSEAMNNLGCYYYKIKKLDYLLNFKKVFLK